MKLSGPIYVRDIIGKYSMIGSFLGHFLFHQLSEISREHPLVDVFELSMLGILATDVSAMKFGIISFASSLQLERGVHVVEFENHDVEDNLNGAAHLWGFPVTVTLDSGIAIFGPRPAGGLWSCYDLCRKRGSLRSTEAVKELDLKLTNASSKLHQLWGGGYLLRREEAHPSGGQSYVYYPI